MIKTPICDFVRKYADSKKLRLHMPGHKGKNFTGYEKYDITEIDGADVLYSSDGIIRESEEFASLLFGTGRTVYSTEGSSLAIRAMLHITKTYAVSHGRKPVIAACRNAHKTFVTASALLGFDVEWIYPQVYDSVLSCKISAEYLDEIICSMHDKPVAVYVTSPDYAGNIADIKSISGVCKKHDILLLTDNAHGAYLRFLPEDTHPISLGADMCCDSAHKTLPVLTGGAYLHISKNAPAEFSDYAEDSMSIFASTSPSYLIMQSLDTANAYMAEKFRQELSKLCMHIEKLKITLSTAGYTLVGDEPAKLTIATKSYGYKGTELAEILESEGIVCEFSDPDYLVMMFSPVISEKEIQYISNVLTGIPKKNPVGDIPPVSHPAKVKVKAQKAIFLPGENIPVQLCKGRILASPTVSCPPAVPIAVCGEELDENAIKCFEYYNISTCNVIKKDYD